MSIKQSTLGFEFENNESGNPAAIQAASQLKTVSQETVELSDAVTFESDASTISAPPKKSSRGRMKLSEMNASAGLIQVPDDDVLFQKSYYSIGAVSEMFKVNQSLIRFWENEFSILKPKKNGKGDRFFRPEDVKNLKLIYHLLRERKYTIEGAKEFLKKKPNADKKFEMIESLKNLKAFLLELKASL